MSIKSISLKWEKQQKFNLTFNIFVITSLDSNWCKQVRKIIVINKCNSMDHYTIAAILLYLLNGLAYQNIVQISVPEWVLFKHKWKLEIIISTTMKLQLRKCLYYRVNRNQESFSCLTEHDQDILLKTNCQLYIQYILARYFNATSGIEQVTASPRGVLRPRGALRRNLNP